MLAIFLHNNSNCNFFKCFYYVTLTGGIFRYLPNIYHGTLPKYIVSCFL